MSEEVVATIYIANYNYGRFIRQSIESALAQQFDSFEVIIIDDGSTDDSRAVIEEYRGNPRVRIILQENRGLVATANLGVRAARGRFVMRLDADDWLDPNALLVMSRALEQDRGLALVFPDYFYVDESGAITGQERRHDFDKVTLLDQPAHGACSLARRDTLLEVGAYSSDITCQDGVDLWFKIVGKYAVKNINLPLFYYRRHGNNLTEQNDRILKQRAGIFRQAAERIEGGPLDVVAVVPVRGPSVDPRDPTLLPLGDRALLDWTLDAVLASEVKDIVVSTPCNDVAAHVRARYGERVGLALRDRQSASENTSFEGAVAAAVAEKRSGSASPDAVLELTVQFPFREAYSIDKATHALRLFGVSRVVSVLPEDDFIYQHDGSGLVAVGGTGRTAGLRLEREYLYRQAGGVLLRRLVSTGPARTGHIVVSRRAAQRVRDAHDLAIARALL